MQHPTPSKSAGVVLAIETSQRAGSVALRDRHGQVREESLSHRKRHDDDLMPAIDRLFHAAGLTPRDLHAGAVCVSIGPGGFTGLRIAVATARMLAESLEVKLIAVPSAIVAAEAWMTSESRSFDSQKHVDVALACKEQTFWFTRLKAGDLPGEWKVIGEPRVMNAAEFEPKGACCVLADEYFPEPGRQRAADAGVPVVEMQLQATACLRVGARKLDLGDTTDPLSLIPLYPRQPEAVTLWERRQQSQ